MDAHGPTDLAFVNGAVHTVDGSNTRAQAVAVRNGRIAAVGSNELIRGSSGRATEMIDLAGRSLLPGFQDAHVHPGGGGLDRLRCDLSQAHTSERYVAQIRAYADTHPDEPWILGGGWAMDVFPGGTPDSAMLDAVVPDRPVFLTNRDSHAAWVNGVGLRLARIDASTPDPADGRIERNAAGEPQGTLQEGAMTLVKRHVPPVAATDIERGILLAQAYLHSLGITAWQDAIVGDGYPPFPDARDVYPSLAARGALTARVVGALWWDRARGLEQVDELIEMRERTTGGRYRATSVKIMQDGVIENLTACMLHPYLDPTGTKDNRGLAYVDPDELPGYVTRLDAEDFQVHVHAIGDKAVRDSLDAFQAALAANGFRDNRHHMAHLQIVHPDDMPRFGALGVTANGQPLWASNDPAMVDLTLPVIGPERGTWQYPFGGLLRAGASLAFGSDWPVSSPDVLEEIHVAVNRTTPPGFLYASGAAIEKEPFLPEHRITLEQAVRAFTMGSAFVNHLDHRTGSIEVGKLADLVVLSEDLFGLESAHITQAKVDMTFVDGRSVYERAGS